MHYSSIQHSEAGRGRWSFSNQEQYYWDIISMPFPLRVPRDLLFGILADLLFTASFLNILSLDKLER